VKTSVCVATLLLLAPFAWRPSAAGDLPADVKPILDKAIQAMGGAEALAKLRCYRLEEDGFSWHGKNKLAVAIVTWEAPPDKIKFRHTQTEELAGEVRTRTFLEALAGGAGWHQEAGQKPKDLDADAVATVEGDLRLPRLQRLADLYAWPNGALTRAAGGRVDGQRVERLQVVTKDLPTCTLSFSADTGLLLKIEARLTVAGGVAVEREIFYYDYRPKGDLNYPHKQVVYINGNRSLELEVKALELLDNINPAEFQKPKS
jgi:hypothetical protein